MSPGSKTDGTDGEKRFCSSLVGGVPVLFKGILAGDVYLVKFFGKGLDGLGESKDKILDNCKCPHRVSRWGEGLLGRSLDTFSA